MIPGPFRDNSSHSPPSSALVSNHKTSSPVSPLSPASSFGSKNDSVTITALQHPRQHSAPQLFLRPASPDSAAKAPLAASLLPPPPQSSTGFMHSKSVAAGLSSSSVGSDDSFVSALSQLDSPKEPGSPRTVPLWKQMLDAIEQEDRQELERVLHAFDFAIVIQTLVTWNLSNTDGQYKHDPDVLLDARELLGPSVDHLNLIQIACFLFNEDLALDLLNFVAKASEELESKKILYEFMGKMWGDGNTTLHLASFLGMADLTKRLLDLGANVYKMNDRKYKPVDCADENTTMSLFLNLTEVVRYRRIGQESLPTSPINERSSDLNWSSFKALGHLRSPSTSTLPLSMLTPDDLRPDQHGEGSSAGLSLPRPASTPGISNHLRGFLLSESVQSLDRQSLGKQDVKPAKSVGQLQENSTCVEGLLLTEPNITHDSQQGDDSLLSPIVICAPADSLAATPSTSTSDFGSLPGALGSLQPTATGDSKFQPQTTSTSPCLSSAAVAAATHSPSYASHIRPKLRSYQSSPSIRLYVDTSVSPSNDAGSLSKPSKPKSTKKRVSFDPQSLMADASRSGDVELYKSMLKIVQEQAEESGETLEEIINRQSASRKLSSLHLAASYNHLALCQFLVDSGADINLGDMEGWTPMHCAAAEGHLKVFEFLASDPEADLQATTFDGELLEDVVEDEDLRQRVIDIIEAQSRMAS
ncbi:hypothetical protein BGZ72_009242 [Mortierella alpina]|nr:hypothetical protein BGZ72_009242 [Mortierella alpina]